MMIIIIIIIVVFVVDIIIITNTATHRHHHHHNDHGCNRHPDHDYGNTDNRDLTENETRQVCNEPADCHIFATIDLIF